MNHKNRLILALFWLLPLAFLGVFFFYPLVSVLIYSLSRTASQAVSPIFQLLGSSTTWRVVRFTFWQAGLSTLLTLSLGLPGAFLLARYQFPGKSLLQALTAVPFVMPTLVVAAAFNALLGPNGWINTGLMALFRLNAPPIHFVNSLVAILTAHVFYNTTIALRTVGDFWSHLDPRLEKAARVLGASRWKTFTRVTLPLLLPAIIAAALLIFIFDFTSFGVILVLGGPRFSTLETEIYTQAVNLLNLPQAAALSLFQISFTLAFTLIYQHFTRRISRPLNLQPRQMTQQHLSTWSSRLGAAVVISILVGLLITPLAALALRSVTPIYDRGQASSQPGIEFNLDFYRELNQNRRQSFFYAPPTTAMLISLGYAAITVTLSLALGFPAAYALARNRGSLTGKALDAALMLPLGTSSVTLGLGFILALDHPPLDLRTSPLLVPLAHTLVALPFVVRSLVPALLSIKPRLRQAASVLGASPFQVTWRVDLPLVSRALLVAGTFAFTISLGEFGATALLARPEYPTIPIAIYRFLGQPGALNYGQALAMSTLLMIVCAAGMLLIERFRLPDTEAF